ncbi:MAG: ABC transporter substrate-binding protein [Alphaproteobacteria bacterium]
MKRRLFTKAFACAFLVAATLSAQAQAKTKTDADQAIDFIRTLAEQAVDVLQDTDAPLSTREEGVQKLLRDNLDLKTMGQFALGAQWRSASPDSREEYLKLFSEYVIRGYARRLGGYSGQTFKVEGSGPAGKYDVLVNTVIVTDDQPEIKAGWRVRTSSDGSLKIIDLVVEGVSMLQTERAQFDSVMQTNGLPGLITSLQDRLKRIDEQSS